MNELFRWLLALPPQSSSIAKEIDVLHYVVIGVSLIGAVAVAVAVAVFLLRFHAGRTYRAPEKARRIPVWVEVVVIAGLLLMFLGFWVLGFRQFVRMQTPPKNAMDVYVVGKKWMWSFAYPDGTGTLGDLYVPVGRPVRLVMTSRDVIHSFFVPDFRIKQDVLPGRTTVQWFEALEPGPHDILCTEYCGTEHSRMRGRVIALTPEDFARWSEGEREGVAAVKGVDLARAGAKVAADRGCLRCHTVDGTPHLGPTWSGLYRSTIRTSDGDQLVADEAYLTESMMDPMRRLRVGFPSIMPTYRGLLEGGEVAALVEYIKSLPANATPMAPPPAAPLPAHPVSMP